MSVAAKVGLAAALLAGIALRLIWGADIEWKADEQFTFEQAMRVGRDLPWPWTGMSTSVFLPNPGLSVWVFVAIARIFAVETPPDLARAIQLLNIAALIGLLVFVARAVPAEQRERWFWAIALAALNPLAVIIERKIWPPSVLPPFMVLFLVGWWFRDRIWGAALWGAIGAAIGQIHMPAMIFAFAIFAWTLAWDRRSARWPAWIAGSCATAWPLIPWALVTLHQAADPTTPRVFGARFPIGTFYTRWLTEPWGFTADYTLGREHYLEFLSAPILFGHATYGFGALHAILALTAIATFVLALRALWRQRPAWRAAIVGATPAGFLAGATLWAYGGLLTISTISIHRHYGAVIYIIKFLWLAAVAFFAWGQARARAILIVVAVLQGLISLGLLTYIHETQVIRGEYGATWQSQQH